MKATTIIKRVIVLILVLTMSLSTTALVISAPSELDVEEGLESTTILFEDTTIPPDDDDTEDEEHGLSDMDTGG